MFVADPFCMFLQVRCKRDSYADVDFSRGKHWETGLHVASYTFETNCSVRILFYLTLPGKATWWCVSNSKGLEQGPGQSLPHLSVTD